MTPKIPKSLEDRRAERPYFDASKLGAIDNYYVCWLDLMGAQSVMRRSLKVASSFVMKIHIACLDVLATDRADVTLLPVIDGVYIVSRNQKPLLYFLKRVLAKLALSFVFEEQPLYQFLVRGAIAFGPLAIGDAMIPGAYTLANNPEYTKRITLGIPLSQAYDDEHRAPPFGIYLNESTRAFSAPHDDVFQGVYWKWWSFNNEAADNELVTYLRDSVRAYYKWAERHPATLLYESSRMKEHLALFEEYLGE
jgi:hypothetical protein